MVRKVCLIYADGSAMVYSHAGGENAALAQARGECAIVNKGERDPARRAQFGTMEIDFGSFKERF